MPFWVAPAIMAGAQIIAQIAANRQQKKANKQAFETQMSAQKELISEQNAYNTPEAQMRRFQDARLNPHLIYGQGNPGNQTTSGNAPEMKTVDHQQSGQNIASAIGNLLPLVNQTKLADSQVQTQTANRTRMAVMNELAEAQRAVLEKNPALDPDTFNAMLDTLKSAATIKANEAATSTMEKEFKLGWKKWTITNPDGTTTQMEGPPGAWKLQREMDLLEQRFKLNDADAQLKAKILESKDFQNAILKVQKDFLVDGDITPEVILKMVALLIAKFSM